MQIFDLSGRVAVVTGGNGGIGLGFARGLVAAGAAVAVVGRDQEKSAAAVKSLQDDGGSARSDIAAFRCDVTSADQIAAMVEAVLARFRSYRRVGQ